MIQNQEPKEKYRSDTYQESASQSLHHIMLCVYCMCDVDVINIITNIMIISLNSWCHIAKINIIIDPCKIIFPKEYTW